MAAAAAGACGGTAGGLRTLLSAAERKAADAVTDLARELVRTHALRATTLFTGRQTDFPRP
jgi:hypothetical protein